MVYKISSTKDLIDAINSGGVKMKHFYLIMSIALGGVILDGYIFATLGIGLPQLAQSFHLVGFSAATVSATMGVGALIGALIGGYLTDRIGRTSMFIVNMILFIIGSFGAAFSVNIYMFLLFRGMMGAGVGLDFPVALSFIAEHSKLSSKGRNVSIWQSINGLGFIVAYFLMIGVYSYLSPGINIWRYAAGLSGIIAVIVLALRFLYMRESPVWLATQGYLKDAVGVLKKNYKMDVEFAGDMVNHKVRTNPVSAFRLLFSKKYRLRTILLTIISPVQAIEYYAVIIYLPVITAQLLVSGNVRSLEFSALFQFFGILGPLMAMAVVQRLGMRMVGMISSVGIIITLLLLGLVPVLTALASVALIAVFIFIHTFGIGPLPMSEASISYPTRIRGTGSGWSQMMIRVGTIVGLFYFPLVSSYFGLKNTFLFLLFVPLVMFFSLLILKWEPVGKDIDSEWSREDEAILGS